MPPAQRTSKITKGADEDDARRRREQHSIQLRKDKRAEGTEKRRKGPSDGAAAAPAAGLGFGAFGAAAAAAAATGAVVVEPAPEPVAVCVERLDEYCGGAWVHPGPCFFFFFRARPPLARKIGSRLTRPPPSPSPAPRPPQLFFRQTRRARWRA
jgi:hypothetical protein